MFTLLLSRTSRNILESDLTFQTGNGRTVQKFIAPAFFTCQGRKKLCGCGVGGITMVNSFVQNLKREWVDLLTWDLLIGHEGNTKVSGTVCVEHFIGSIKFGVDSRNFLLTGLQIGWEEPYEARVSRTVLWEPEGEIPSGYSTHPTTKLSDSGDFT